MYELAGRAVAAVRVGLGPRFIEIKTARWRDHAGPGEDRHHGYRCDDHLDTAIPDDQVARIASMLEDDARREIAEKVEREIADAVACAEAGTG